MKINVNEYNEILSYEGTPEELAEFVATGILFPYMEYDEEECDCEEEQDESVIVPDAMDAEEPVVETPKTADEILEAQKEKILEQYEPQFPENIQVLTEFVGDELEILDPYGGALQAYGLCYETLRKSIKKLVTMLNEGE